jgi:Fic family protein
MLSIIDESLNELLHNSAKKLSAADRIQLFIENAVVEFSRKDYLNYFKDVSSATASRDLKKGVENGIIQKSGDKKTTVYKKI